MIGRKGKEIIDLEYGRDPLLKLTGHVTVAEERN
jgi:hypothetical protein